MRNGESLRRVSWAGGQFGNLGDGNHSAAYIRNCLWSEHGQDYYCPVFMIGDITRVTRREGGPLRRLT